MFRRLDACHPLTPTRASGQHQRVAPWLTLIGAQAATSGRTWCETALRGFLRRLLCAGVALTPRTAAPFVSLFLAAIKKAASVGRSARNAYAHDACLVSGRCTWCHCGALAPVKLRGRISIEVLLLKISTPGQDTFFLGLSPTRGFLPGGAPASPRLTSLKDT